MIRCIHFVLIFHQVYGRYLAVPNIEPVHNLYKRLVGIPHHHIILPLDPLVVDGCDGFFLQGAVHIFD